MNCYASFAKSAEAQLIICTPFMVGGWMGFVGMARAENHFGKSFNAMQQRPVIYAATIVINRVSEIGFWGYPKSTLEMGFDYWGCVH